ncbi:hypothetical protein FHW89_004028 [Mucilaginibacter sp. SG564]|nr:hypothetical protein [Mucilaginibacter sp. SG564]
MLRSTQHDNILSESSTLHQKFRIVISAARAPFNSAPAVLLNEKKTDRLVCRCLIADK